MVASYSRFVLVAAVLLLCAALTQFRPVAADGSWKSTGPTGGFVWELAA